MHCVLPNDNSGERINIHSPYVSGTRVILRRPVDVKERIVYPGEKGGGTSGEESRGKTNN